MQNELRELLRHFFPTVPPPLTHDFNQYQKRVARRLAVLAAGILILVLPLFHMLEAVSNHLTPTALFHHALIRTPLFILAVLVLTLRLTRPRGGWPRPALLILGFTLIMIMMGLLLYHLAKETGYAMATSSGLIMSIATTSILATRGTRDLLAIYLAPTLFFLGGLWWLDISLRGEELVLVYPLMMTLVGVILAETQYRGHITQFLMTQNLQQRATTDPLTGLFNRRAMDSVLAMETARAKRHGEHFAVIMADLDHFKKVNDQHGHEVGDEVLQELASRFRASLRGEDHVARWGGEEFLILLREAQPEIVMQVAEKIRQTVAQRPFSTKAGRISVTISLGAACHQVGEAADATIARADVALYQAKDEGRNRTILAKHRQ